MNVKFEEIKPFEPEETDFTNKWKDVFKCKPKYVLYAGARGQGKKYYEERIQNENLEQYKREILGDWSAESDIKPFDPDEFQKCFKESMEISEKINELTAKIAKASAEAKEHWLIQDIIGIYNYYLDYKSYVLACNHFNTLIEQAEKDDDVKLPRREIISEETFNYIKSLRS